MRRLDPGEWELYRHVRLAALKEAPYAFGSTYERETGFDEAAWRHLLTVRTRFVAEVDGEVAGTVSGGDSDHSGSAVITAMWVEPRFRRRGVAELLLNNVFAWARANGYFQIGLWVTEGNAAAERLYEGNGFIRTGEVSLVRQGEDRIEYEMARRL